MDFTTIRVWAAFFRVIAKAMRAYGYIQLNKVAKAEAELVEIEELASSLEEKYVSSGGQTK